MARLVIELIVDCMRCARSATVFSSKNKIEGNPLYGWQPTKTGWKCPEHKEEG